MVKKEKKKNRISQHINKVSLAHSLTCVLTKSSLATSGLPGQSRVSNDGDRGVRRACNVDHLPLYRRRLLTSLGYNVDLSSKNRRNRRNRGQCNSNRSYRGQCNSNRGTGGTGVTGGTGASAALPGDLRINATQRQEKQSLRAYRAGKNSLFVPTVQVTTVRCSLYH